ncbi:response regulator [Ferrimonas lipolytica]|uniref:Response regulator n=1 Tax=Ferrimonas lipolytica TaxID=2724191 RepID=A0A6H1UG45_9GAMM|nr:response regulator [Ferrimonas lipolytica]QIZ77599.1 response regulator [Ferrimonas lipolytica]
MSSKRLLIIEDEAKIAQLLKDYFVLDGYDVSLLFDGADAVEIIRAMQPDCVILDLMLPVKDGLTICKEVRQFSEVPIIMVTARVDEIDRLLGLELGADDYVCKPFLPREVVARVKTILRRVNRAVTQVNDHNQLSYRDLTLQLDQYLCRVDGQAIDLTPVEFRLLQTLVKQPGRVFSRDALMSSCYQDDRVVSDRTIDSHIKNLRKKMVAVKSGCDYIHSIYGVGYKLD